MKDYDILVKGHSEVTLAGDSEWSVAVTEGVEVDNRHRSVDIEIRDLKTAKIAVPHEVPVVEFNIEDSWLNIEDITFEKIEIDGKGKIVVELKNTTGPIDINMIGGECELRVPEGYFFKTAIKGKNNVINSDIEADPASANVIEINGKDSTLHIVRLV